MWKQHDKSSPWRSPHGPLPPPPLGPAASHPLHHADCHHSPSAAMGLWQESGDIHRSWCHNDFDMIIVLRHGAESQKGPVRICASISPACRKRRLKGTERGD